MLCELAMHKQTLGDSHMVYFTWPHDSLPQAMMMCMYEHMYVLYVRMSVYVCMYAYMYACMYKTLLASHIVVLRTDMKQRK